MTIQFIKRYDVSPDVTHESGEVIIVPDAIGADLIQRGFAKERKPPGPTEFKAETGRVIDIPKEDDDDEDD